MRLLTIDPSRLVLIFGALVLCGVVALHHLLSDPAASAFSFGYLVVLYAPFVAVVRRPQRWIVDRLFDRFETLMLVAALVALLQMGSQLLGIGYSDILGDVVPQHFLVPGYNTSYPLTYGSSIYKSNAYLFLEPSFLSQFLGTAVVVRLARGKVGWRLFIYLAAIATTVAGTGMVLALVGGLLVLFTRNARVVAIVFGPLVAIGAAVAATPLGGILAARALEVGNSDSSASLRFVQPFQVLGGAWTADIRSMLLGHGPGASERYVVQLTGSTTLQQPVPLKLVFDYGGIAAVVFLVAFAVCVLWRPPLRPLAGGLLLAYLLLSSALLQPITVLTVWLLTSALSHVPDPATAQAGSVESSLPAGRPRPAPPPTNEAELMTT